MSPVPANDQPLASQIIATLSKMELRSCFKAEANCHRAMLQRCKSYGVVVHPDFRDFRSFLLKMGPSPAYGATVDRIDPADPEYAPGKVRWADKTTQTRNRQSTVLINLPDGGVLTPEQLAPRLGVSPDTIRKRRNRGWTDDEILRGKRDPLKLSPPAHREVEPPAPKAAQRVFDGSNRHRGWWHSLFSEFGPTDEEITAIEGYLRSRRFPMSRRQKEFDELRREFLQARERGEPDPVPATYEMFLEIHSDGEFGPPTLDVRTRSDRKAAEFWPRYKPHVIFENLEPAYVMVLRRIDPQYVVQQEARIAQTREVGYDL